MERWRDGEKGLTEMYSSLRKADRVEIKFKANRCFD